MIKMKIKMKRLIAICVIMLTLAVLSNIASADITNGGFESGDFTGWSTIGVTSIETAAYGTGPTEGSYQALVTSPEDNGFLVSDSTIETFLGLAAGTLDGLIAKDATVGSAIKQTITASAGDMLTFDWNFLTDEVEEGDDVPDFTFVSIVSGTTEILADAVSSTFVSSSTPFFDETGFTMFQYTFPTSGTFTLGFGVMHVEDDDVDSGLLLDNVTIIPEPTTICLLGLGALSLLHKRKK
jgi:hypothetical protein